MPNNSTCDQKPVTPQEIDMKSNQADHLLTDVYLALSSLMNEFHIDLGALFYGLTNFHIKQLANANARKSILRIALRSGIDRRAVSMILKNTAPVYKDSSLTLIIKHMQLISEKNNKRINKKGIDSIESIINHVAPGATTLKTVIDELVDMGAIKDAGTHVTVQKNPFVLSAQQCRNLKYLSRKWLESINGKSNQNK